MRQPSSRLMMSISIMLSTFLTSIDITIANVALPHMAGSVNASADQITWVLTSYIVASAVVTPMAGWLAGRFGRKRIFLISVIGFTIASAACGFSQNLAEIVIFRALQGALGASMQPLSQAMMIDAYPLEERGPAMAMWSMAMLMAPILGPAFGGWLTDNYSWRWVFFINLPLGVLAVAGVIFFIPDQGDAGKPRFDITGFALLSIALAAFQVFLDRGQGNDWFSSTETIIEGATAGLAFLLFAIHIAIADHPFMPLGLLRDQNFLLSTFLGFMLGIILFSVLALLPPLTENLLGYPVVTTGIVMAPRGIGSFISIFICGRLVSRVDNRIMIACGLGLFGFSFIQMSGYALNMTGSSIAWAGVFQGLGTGMLFMPMSVMGFSTLPAHLRADGAAFQAVIRNLGNSAGISIMETIFTRNVQIVHARLTEPFTADNPLTRGSLADPTRIAMLNGEITRQASMVAYVDIFHLMFVITLFMLPTALLLRQPKGPQVIDETNLALE